MAGPNLERRGSSLSVVLNVFAPVGPSSVSHSFTPDEKKNSPSRNVLALTGLSEAIGKQRVETTPELRVGDGL